MKWCIIDQINKTYLNSCIYRASGGEMFFNGEGSMIHTSGVSYEGMWVNGRPEGIIKYVTLMY